MDSALSSLLIITSIPKKKNATRPLLPMHA